MQFETVAIVILTLFQTLPLYCIRNDITRSPIVTKLAGLINSIGDLYELTSVCVFYHSQFRESHDVDELLSELHHNSSSYFANKIFISGNEKSQMRLEFVVPNSTLLLIFASNFEDSIINAVAQTCRGRRGSHTIFIINDPLNYGEREQFFAYLWKKQFRKPLLLQSHTYSMPMYTISPYPALKVLNVTGGKPSNCFPVDSYFNLQGYSVRVPVQLDIPQTFWFLKEGERKLDGIAGRFFRTFMKRMNVTLESYALDPEPNYLNISKLTQMLQEEQFEITPHLLTMIDKTPHMEYSYPYIITRRCFMLPLHNEIPRNMYLLKPFDRKVWIMIGLFIIFLTVIIELLRLDRSRNNHKTLQAGAGFFWALSIILARTSEINLVYRYRRAGYIGAMRPFFCFLLLSFAGEYIAQTYSSTLTSFLTVTLFARPSASVSTLLKTKQPIMILQREEEAIMSSSKFPDPAFRKLFVYADSYEYNINRYSLNLSFVYPISRARWEFLNEQQRLLKRKRFWLSDICSGEYPMQFQLQHDSHFYQPMHFFILWVHESGLHDFWRSKSFNRAKKMNYVHDFYNNEDTENKRFPRGLSLKLLSPCFYVFLTGHLLSLCLLMLELTNVKLRRILREFRNRPVTK